MENIQTKLTGTVLTITIDLAKRFGPSASGKTIRVASTEGGMKVTLANGDLVNVGINAFTKAGK
jgi:hypothetical protein